jgi:hypothetical protein
MQFKPPKDNDKYQWTNHVKDKMVYYGISESLIKRIVRFPKRREEGIAPGTVASMSPYGKSSAGKQPYRGEVWVMHKEISQKAKIKSQNPKVAGLDFLKMRIISAWRYPGVSPAGKKIPIPEEILQELEGVI